MGLGTKTHPYNWLRLWGYLSFSEINVPLWWVQVQTRKNLLVPNAKIISLTLNAGEIVKLVYVLLKLAGAGLEVGVTSLMKRILEAYSCRSTVCGGGYATNDGERLLQVLTLLLMIMGMTTIGLGQELLLVILFSMTRIAIISIEIGAHLAKV